MNRKNVGKRKDKWKIALIVFIETLFLAMISALIFFIKPYCDTHFQKGTIINGIDCSNLTLEEAQEKLGSFNVTFSFQDGKIYTEYGYNVGIHLRNTEKLEEFLTSQRPFGTNNEKQFQLAPEDFEVDEETLRNYMKLFDELQENNAKRKQNAYLILNEDGYVQIVPEVYGTYIDFEEAVQTSISSFKNGIYNVNLALLCEGEPEIQKTSTVLIEKRDALNKILNTVINFTFKDGSIVTLDHEMVLNWIFGDITQSNLQERRIEEDLSTYVANLEPNLKKFVDDLETKVNKLGSTMEFVTTTGERVTLTVAKGHRDKLDTESELEKIKQELETGETITREPIYSRINQFEKFDSYVEVDIENQTVYMYVNGECIVKTPCVTGNVSRGTVTREGVFYLTGKYKDTVLSDNKTYWSHVNFWMPFDGGIGLHDATWRSRFGGDIYKTNGSHGCVNLPKSAAKTIYENITKDMPIIVH